jgi:hypothetical protein
MITALLIVLAAIFKALADTLQHHFDTSVFSKLNQKFWNPVVSCNYVRFLPFTKYRPDAWHLANSGMIICFIAAASISDSIFSFWLINFVMLGIIFNLIFELFYGKIFIKWN